MAIDKRNFEQTCIKAVRKENVAKRCRASTPILKRSYVPVSPSLIRLSQRRDIMITPRKLFASPQKFQTKPMKNRIQFYSKVQVVYIPSKDQYPESMKATMWSNSAEIRRNARRNTIEFAAEGWDWRTVCEDDAMYVSPDGQRIHPVHVRRYRSS
jgi:hypothetical protein